ncbi:MAG: hypothetical protein FWD13_12170 [Treponema sp.]|nr:hypothetical protein [Treponema sp.]
MEIFVFLLIGWYVIFFIQTFMSYGTAYRWTKRGGDNGIALFGWFIVLGFASLIPGLGIALWAGSKNDNYTKRIDNNKKCRQCNKIYSNSGQFCPNCGSSLYEGTNLSVN